MVLDRIDGGTRSLEIAVDEEPDAFIFKNRIKSYIFAHLCGDCGFLEFYAKTPQAIYTAFQKSKNQKIG